MLSQTCLDSSFVFPASRLPPPASLFPSSLFPLYFAESVRGGDRLSTTAANSVYAAGVSTLNGFVT